MFEFVIPGVLFIVYCIGLFALTNILKTEQMNRRESVIIFFFILGVILLDVLNSNFFKFGWLIAVCVGVGMLFPTAIMLITSNERAKKIEEKKAIIAEVVMNHYKKLDESKLDIKVEHGKISEFSFPISPDYHEQISGAILEKMSKIHPDVTWDCKTDFTDLMVTVNSYPQAPFPSIYPGSSRRPWNFLVLGLNHKGELGWNLGTDKHYGQSSYIYSNSKGKRAKTVETSSAPQSIFVGSTGGGKALAVNQKVSISRFTSNER